MAAHRSNRPLAWLTFGTGGFLVAFFFPIHILLTGFLVPLGLVPDPGRASMLHLLEHPLTQIYLAVLLIFAFWHAAYRLRDLICDMLDIRQLDTVVMALCYSAAAVGSIATIVLLVQVP
jgi:fumarate reductase subunit D